MAFVKIVGYLGCGGLALYLCNTMSEELRIARYKRRPSTNEGIMDKKEVEQEEKIRHYLDNHCAYFVSNPRRQPAGE